LVLNKNRLFFEGKLNALMETFEEKKQKDIELFKLK
jgi:hypothetical protein